MSDPTLDQLRVLITVVECGSFSGAGRRLNRTQSVISYTIATLERQLALRLFVRGQRRPVLTEAGRAMLADARRVTATADELRARAAAMSRGLEAELSVAVDVLFPTCRLVALLEAFAAQFPTVTLRLRVEALGAVPQLVLDGDCALGISGAMATRFDALERMASGEVELIGVAAPAHPLARDAARVTARALREQVQLVLTDRSRVTEGEDFGVLSPRTWRLGDLGAKHALLLAGLGWGFMPEPTVREDVASGRLVRLAGPGRYSNAYQFLLVRRADTPPGPAAQWLGAAITAHAEEPI